MTTHRLLLSLTLFVLSAAGSRGNPIAPDAALRNAREFVATKANVRRAGAVATLTPAFSLPYGEREAAGAAAIYVYNLTGGGFVIASGDDAAEPILGYGEQGRLEAESLPCNMKVWLDGCRKEIEWAARQQADGHIIAKASTSPKASIANLVDAKWGQYAPYYHQCYGGGCAYYLMAGCVATAMAQIMYYWGVQGLEGTLFQHGCTALSAYNTNTKGYQMSALGAVKKFDWDNMTATEPTTSESKKAVAQLIRYCGQSVKMDYDTPSNGGSGAYSEDIPQAFHTNFGYDHGVVYALRRHMTYAEWEDLIYGELASGRPIVLDGENSNGTGGHAFICTGYQSSTGKFYINWGWDGSYNGWFALNALKMSTKDYNYRSGAVIGIQPPTDDSTLHDYERPQLEYLYLHSTRTLERGHRSEAGYHPLTLECAFEPPLDTTTTWETAIGLYDADNTLLYTSVPTTIGYHRPLVSRLSLGEELPYGTYTLTAVCRAVGESEWHKAYHAQSYYVEATVGADAITLTPSVDVSCTAVTSTRNSGKSTYTNTLVVSNHGCRETVGVYTLLIDGQEKCAFEPHIPAGSADTITLGYTKAITASQVQALALDRYGFLRLHVNVAASEYAEIAYEATLDGVTDLQGRHYGDMLPVRIYLTNKGTQTYAETVVATLVETDSGIEVEQQTSAVSLAPHESQTLSFDFAQVQTGSRYDIRLDFPHTDDDGIVQQTMTMGGDTLHYTPTRGIVVATPDGLTVTPDDGIAGTLAVADNALYADARHSDHWSALLPGQGANTLYLLPADADIPSSLQGHNVVIGQQAKCIHLQHGQDFLSPIEFTADSISYHRTFSKGLTRDNSGWETIALPFDVSSDGVAADGKPTGWFTSPTDAGWKFWLFTLASNDGDELLFDYTDHIAANTPYLIAVPGDRWGKAFDLRGLDLTFTATHAKVPGGTQKAVGSAGPYDLIGRYCSAARPNEYVLNEEGNRFVRSDAVAVPFTAYVVDYLMRSAALTSLSSLSIARRANQ